VPAQALAAVAGVPPSQIALRDEAQDVIVPRVPPVVSLP
jgi:hypothetical protein